MTATVEHLAQQIQALPEAEYDELRSWLATYEVQHAASEAAIEAAEDAEDIRAVRRIRRRPGPTVTLAEVRRRYGV